jgi:hypothetical protein
MRIGRQRRVNGWKRDRALGMLTLDLDVPLMAVRGVQFTAVDAAASSALAQGRLTSCAP